MNLRMVALVMACLASALPANDCSDGGGKPDTSSSPITAYHDLISPEQYFDLIRFDLAELNTYREDYGLRSYTKSEYLAAVSNLKSNGPNSLSADGWSLLVVVSWYAYVVQAKTLTFELVERGPSCETLSDQLVQQQYDIEQVGVPPVPGVPLLVGERQQEIENSAGAEESCAQVQAALPTTPAVCGTPDPNAEWEETLVVDREKDEVSSTRWSRRDGEWSCEHDPNPVAYGMIMQVRPFVDVDFVHATLIGVETVQGRQTYKLRAAEGSSEDFEQATYYWMDAETLLPLRYEYRLSDVCRQGNTRQFRILEVNGSVDINPPDVDVTCE